HQTTCALAESPNTATTRSTARPCQGSVPAGRHVSGPCTTPAVTDHEAKLRQPSFSTIRFPRHPVGGRADRAPPRGLLGGVPGTATLAHKGLEGPWRVWGVQSGPRDVAAGHLPAEC